MRTAVSVRPDTTTRMKLRCPIGYHLPGDRRGWMYKEWRGKPYGEYADQSAWVIRFPQGVYSYFRLRFNRQGRKSMTLMSITKEWIILYYLRESYWLFVTEGRLCWSIRNVLARTYESGRWLTGNQCEWRLTVRSGNNGWYSKKLTTD